MTELLTQVAAGASVNGIVAPSGASGGALGSASVLIQDVGGGNGVNQQQPVVAAAFRSPNVVAPGSQPIPYLPARSASGGAASSMPFSNGGLARSHYPFASMTHAAHTMLAGHPRIHPFIRPPARPPAFSSSAEFFQILVGRLSISITIIPKKERKKSFDDMDAQDSFLKISPELMQDSFEFQRSIEQASRILAMLADWQRILNSSGESCQELSRTSSITYGSPDTKYRYFAKIPKRI